MEKIIYLISRQDEQNRDDFARLMKQDVTPQLLAAKPLGLQLNLADETVAAGDAMAMESIAAKAHAVVSIWLHCAINRAPIEKVLTATGASIAGYLVTESCPLRNTTHVVSAGERTPGFAQVALLQRPPRLSVEQWIEVWQYSHTGIAIDTQSTFSYTQNLVVRSLTENAPKIDAIVEESFPLAALTDQAVFYDAQGDDEKLARNSQAMMESCGRFIDFDKINVCSTSEYIYKCLPL
ncbi:MAG: hypothetical protein ACJAQS_000675 [Porticoccus sp.]